LWKNPDRGVFQQRAPGDSLDDGFAGIAHVAPFGETLSSDAEVMALIEQATKIMDSVRLRVTRAKVSSQKPNHAADDREHGNHHGHLAELFEDVSA
jgi:hypothetical protein